MTELQIANLLWWENNQMLKYQKELEDEAEIIEATDQDPNCRGCTRLNCFHCPVAGYDPAETNFSY
jgi:hypothetical protein